MIINSTPHKQPQSHPLPKPQTLPSTAYAQDKPYQPRASYSTEISVYMSIVYELN